MHSMRRTAPDVDLDMSSCSVFFQSQNECPCNICDVDKIAQLIAVFINDGRVAIHQPRMQRRIERRRMDSTKTAEDHMH